LDQAKAGVALATVPARTAAARVAEMIFFEFDMTLSLALLRKFFSLRMGAI
jgi:hypothetical protein